MNIQFKTDDGLVDVTPGQDIPNPVRAYAIVTDEKATNDFELTFSYGDVDIFPDETFKLNDDSYAGEVDGKHEYTCTWKLITKVSTGDDCPPPLVLEYNVGATGTGQAYTINRTDGTLPAGDIRQGTEPELMLTRGAVYTCLLYTSPSPRDS